MSKKWLVSSALAVLILAGCGDDLEKSSEGTTKEKVSGEQKKETKFLAEEEFDKMYTDPKSYMDYEVTYTGKVLQTPEVDNDGVYLQVYAKPESYEQNTIVFYPDSTFEASEGDYVKITGIIYDEFKGENMLGGEVKAPAIKVEKLEITNYIDAVAPTIETVEVNEDKEQHGFKLTLDKIELAETQTRVYFTVTNASKHKITFYDFNSKIVADGKQLENVDIYESGLEKIQSELLPGTSSSGFVIYPALEKEIEKIQIYAEGYSENYEITIEPFIFEVAIE